VGAEPETIICFHCGNETPMQKIEAYSWGSNAEDDWQCNYLYEFYKCPVCNRPTLRESYIDEDDWCIPDALPRVSNLYPANSIEAEAVPVEIAKAYEAALRVKGIDSGICALALRKALEMILIDKGAQEYHLAAKIEEMAEKGVLPESLKEASEISRLLGNDAAHDYSAEFDAFEIEYMVEFIGHILGYLYILPHRLDGFKRWAESKQQRRKEAPLSSGMKSSEF